MGTSKILISFLQIFSSMQLTMTVATSLSWHLVNPLGTLRIFEFLSTMKDLDVSRGDFTTKDIDEILKVLPHIQTVLPQLIFHEDHFRTSDFEGGWCAVWVGDAFVFIGHYINKFLFNQMDLFDQAIENEDYEFIRFLVREDPTLINRLDKHIIKFVKECILN